MIKTKLTGDCDVVSLAGAAKNLANPAIEAARELMLYQVQLAVILHEITDVYLMNHLDCAAYGRSVAFDSAEEEFRRHSHDLGIAAQMVEERHPHLAVHLLLADRQKNGIEIHKIPPLERGGVELLQAAASG